MADQYVLEAQPRAITGKKVSQLRRQGLVPVVVYGPQIQPMHLQIPHRALQVILMKAGGTHLIDMQVDGKIQSVIAREVQRDILKGDILHADFFAVDESSTIRVDVPIHYVNESPAVQAHKGILVTGPTMLTIETLPSKLLDRIEVDLTPLAEIGDAIFVRHIQLGGDIVVINDPDEMIARISQTSAARSAEDEAAEAAAEAGPTEVEIIRKGKADEDEEA